MKEHIYVYVLVYLCVREKGSLVSNFLQTLTYLFLLPDKTQECIIIKKLTLLVQILLPLIFPLLLKSSLCFHE